MKQKLLLWNWKRMPTAPLFPAFPPMPVFTVSMATSLQHRNRPLCVSHRRRHSQAALPRVASSLPLSPVHQREPHKRDVPWPCPVHAVRTSGLNQ